MSDYISRADAIEAVCRTRCGDKAKGCPAHSCLVIEEFDALPSADAVPQTEHDREWIIGCIKHDGFIKTDRFDKANQIILDALSADALQGEWIEVEDYNGDVHYKCDQCGEEWTFPFGTPKENNANFCPNCGARMENK